MAKRLMGGTAVLLALAASALILVFPRRRPPSTEPVARTPARLERGRYLGENVSGCLHCHSEGMPVFAFPPRPGTEGQGGFPFGRELGVPGLVQAQNITSDEETGLGRWTDGEILRAIREGISRDGHALFPMMPYPNYRAMADDDAQALVAWLRTLPPIRHHVSARQLDFPVNLFVQTLPRPVDGPVRGPAPSAEPRVRGRYLATIAGCADCHTPRDAREQPIAARAFAGGFVMRGPWGTVVSANLTPAPDTWLGQATREEFIGRFRQFDHWDDARPLLKGRNTVMPWRAFAGMTEDDLGALWAFLKSLPPVPGAVESFPDAVAAR